MNRSAWGVPAGDPLLVNWVENFMGIAEKVGLFEAAKKRNGY